MSQPLYRVIHKIQSVLTSDLLKVKPVSDRLHAGHCYVASEVLYLLLGGRVSNYVPCVLNHRVAPEILGKGETHWFLKNTVTGKIVDITKDQFGDRVIPYERGRVNMMMNHPVGGSKRVKEVIKRMGCHPENSKRTWYENNSRVFKR